MYSGYEELPAYETTTVNFVVVISAIGSTYTLKSFKSRFVMMLADVMNPLSFVKSEVFVGKSLLFANSSDMEYVL